MNTTAATAHINANANANAGVLKRITVPFMHGARQALQWRLLTLWLAAMALPWLLGLLPLWLGLAEVLDHALLGRRLVENFDLTVISEAISALRPRGYAPASGLGAAVVFVLLLPGLTGLVMAAARAPQRLKFGGLLMGAWSEYGRMARLWLWALLPLGLAAAAGGAMLKAAKEQALTMTLESDAELLGRAALVLAALLFLLAHATVDAARAQLVIEPRRRSVVRAWWRGLRGLMQHPSRLLVYAAVTIVGLLLAALVAWLRIRVAPINGLRFIAALLLGQALVLVLAWMRCARLFALVAAGRG